MCTCPQAKQRMENALGPKTMETGQAGRLPPAAPEDRTPRHAGISGREKSPETIRALVNGGAEEDRTPDLRIANATLSQLSYRPEERGLYTRRDFRAARERRTCLPVTARAQAHGGIRAARAPAGRGRARGHRRSISPRSAPGACVRRARRPDRRPLPGSR